ncbi:hypothetical protein L1887_36479 [Cichorium endivia]|nr:hypothetical protein L1887_36479 [Cichorium endivia]
MFRSPPTTAPLIRFTFDSHRSMFLDRRKKKRLSADYQISRTTRTNDESSLLIQEGGLMCEFAIPGSQNTTVLVVGATSRVGRIVVRKIMLMGYSVKALVRNADEEVVAMLPTSVKIVIGDVGDPTTLRVAGEGCRGLVADWFSDLMFLVDSGSVIVLLLLP